MGIREIRRDIGSAVDRAHYLKEPTVITKNGKDLAFIGPHEWLTELEQYREKFGPLDAD